MSLLDIVINDIPVQAEEGTSILDAARLAGVEIPTLCHDERVKTYGACGVCVVEIEGNPRLVRACSTVISPGMKVKTDTERARSTRKTALELLLSDHKGDCRPPCLTACPGNTDCQGYVGLIANGEFDEAIKLIKEKIPLPASIGRVCPHPCEEACRRQLVEEPIAIAHLKAFAADIDLSKKESFLPEKKASLGKKVAIIGGGPAGLSLAYFLTIEGAEATVYDAMPEMGGMLRYGIPEYRLPKEILNKEIQIIESLGVKLINNTKIGEQITLDSLKKDYDAVVIAIGAWKSSALGCKGEDAEGVEGGIDFLRDAALNRTPLTDKVVAVVGGGNTAMDSVRTAVRLGAKAVYNIYRRTKAEMPSEEIEIKEAEEEGVIFKYLTNPIEIINENGKAVKIHLQKMKLGEKDASGRQAPVPIEGETETLDIDKVIIAIGQQTEPSGFDAVEKTRRGTISADESTLRTNIEGVFAIGDATNKGADIAITAIGEAVKAKDVIISYLKGKNISYKAPYIVTTQPTAQDFNDKARLPRVKMPHQSPEERKANFKEVNLGLTAKQAVAEGARCLECGCLDYFECKLIDYANQYEVKPEKFQGEDHSRCFDTSNPYIYRNPEKCILCGLCVRICDEVIGASALGLVNRGFDTVVAPPLTTKLSETDCVSCGACVNSCPTGALTEQLNIQKSVPLKEKATKTTCSGCSVGCQTEARTRGELLLRYLPETYLCEKGRFGFNNNNCDVATINEDKAEISDALAAIKKELEKFSPSEIFVYVSGARTNEEAFLIRKFAKDVIKTDNLFTTDMSPELLLKETGTKAKSSALEVIHEAVAGKTPVMLKANAQGLENLGIVYKEEQDSNAKATLSFNDGSITLKTQESSITIPLAPPIKTNGTYYTSNNTLAYINKALPLPEEKETITIINSLAGFNYNHLSEIQKEMGIGE